MSPEHGERRTYLRGCRCEPCTSANAAYCKGYRNRAHKAGGVVRVPATRARAHLAALSDHYSSSSVATLAQMNSSAIYRIGAGLQDTVTRDVESRILAVRPGSDVGRQWVNPLGARRRIQALAAIGYAIHWQSTRLNYQKSSLMALIRGDKPFITSAVDQRIRDLYDELSMAPRVGRDQIERGSVTKALRMAERNGWAPPLAWTNIDDPNEQPDLGAPDAKGGNGGRSIANLLEDAEWLADGDAALSEVIERLDVKPDTFRDTCARAGRSDLYWRLARREPDGDMRWANRRVPKTREEVA